MNDGFRVIIERQGNSFYWEFTLLGERYNAPRGEPTIALAAEAADNYRRQIELGWHFKKQREEREASRS
jgi:hypothetical protein